MKHQHVQQMKTGIKIVLMLSLVEDLAATDIEKSSQPLPNEQRETLSRRAGQTPLIRH